MKGSHNGWMVTEVVTDDLQFHIRLDSLVSHVECLITKEPQEDEQAQHYLRRELACKAAQHSQRQSHIEQRCE